MPKKIYFVVHDFSHHAGGGVNRVVSETANELSKDKNIDVNILSLADLDGGTAYPVSEQVRLHSLKMKKYSTTQYKGILKIIWLFIAYINVIKFYLTEKAPCSWNLTSPPLIILFSLFLKGNQKFINCEHISPQRKKYNIVIEILRKFILNRADITISLNKSDHNYYVKHGIKAKLIYNGVNFPEEIDLEREKKIIFVGRFEDQKNPLAALEIFYESNLWKEDYVLNLFGYGKYHQDILYNAKKIGILDRIKVITNENDPNKIYSKASCLIMTSRYEGLPMVLIEAMARGVPCISYDCPQGPSEIIKNGINGYLIPVSDRKEFIQKLGLVVNNSIQPELIIESVQEFNISNVIQQWECLIEN